MYKKGKEFWIRENEKQMCVVMHVLTFCESSEDLLDTCSSSCTGTKVCSTKLFGLSLCLVHPDLSIALEIGLIANDDDGHFVSKLCPQLLHPLLHSLE